MFIVKFAQVHQMENPYQQNTTCISKFDRAKLYNITTLRDEYSQVSDMGKLRILSVRISAMHLSHKYQT